MNDTQLCNQPTTIVSEFDQLNRLVHEIRAVASDICLSDLRIFSVATTLADEDEALCCVLSRMHEDGTRVLRVQRGDHERDIIIPLECIDRQLATPFGQPVFLKRRVGYLIDSIDYEPTQFTRDLTIGEACARSIARDEATRNDPVMILESGVSDDWVISVQQLLLVQSCYLEQILEENERQRAAVIEAQRVGDALQNELGVTSRKAALAEHAIRSMHRVERALQAVSQQIGEMIAVGRDLHELDEIVRNTRSIIEESVAESSKMGVLEELSCTTLWREVLEVVRRDLEAHGIEIAERFEACPTILCNHQLVLRALVTLMTNAIESIATHNGETRRIELSARPALQCGVEGVELSIRDSGVGIEPDEFDLLFSPDFSTKAYDRGEGLHLAKNAIEGLGGAIWAESNGAGHGACLSVLLPLRAPEAGREGSLIRPAA
ncbi:MAG: sensor histidine kinase [Phycisphaerales bacterium]